MVGLGGGFDEVEVGGCKCQGGRAECRRRAHAAELFGGGHTFRDGIVKCRSFFVFVGNIT